MAISPPSDLVFDVVRAADPAQYQASVKKLQHMQNSATAGRTESVRFADFVAEKDPPVPNFAEEPKRVSEAYRNFEAFMLQSFVQNMFTTSTPSVFGKGLAGEYWKSMLAEMVARKMAENGGIGIASMLEGHHLHSSPESTDPHNTANAIVQTSQLEMIRRHFARS